MRLRRCGARRRFGAFLSKNFEGSWTRFLEQTQPDITQVVAALRACKKLGDLERGKKLHSDIIERGDITNRCIAASLINMYTSCGSLVDARRVFDSMVNRDSAAWTNIILGYAEAGEGETALELFHRMEGEIWKVDDFAILAAVKACCSLAGKETGHLVSGKTMKLKSLKIGMEVHSKAAKHFCCYENIFIANILICMYSKCGSVLDSRLVFDRMAFHDVISWTSLLLGYVDCGDPQLALDLFFSMETQGCDADARVYLAAIKACSSLATLEHDRNEDEKLVNWRLLEKGRMIHHQAEKTGFTSDLYVASTMVDMYAKCGSMADARKVFDTMSSPDVVTWTSLMLGYAESGEGDLALDLFTRMQQRGCELDPVIFVAALKACSDVVNFKFGKVLHSEICRCGMESNFRVANCLVDFYCKSGSMSEAEEVFISLPSWDLVTWSALIAGYSRQGDTERVFHLVQSMWEQGIQADNITFVSILTACSHGGLTEKGKEIFHTMRSRFGVKPGIEHYLCMVDILGRGSQLEAALELVQTMPFPPGVLTWRTILGACRKWKNVEVGRVAFEELIKLDNRNAAPYTLMANIYGSLGMWEDQSRVEGMRVKAGAWRTPGKSWWTDDEGTVHSFVVGDNRHAQRREIEAKLKELVLRMKEEGGYVVDASSVLHNIQESEKQGSLCGHSERLAIGCALINTAPGATLRIMKNLRVCDDCHQAIAVISKLAGRKIICRDASRFHVYQDGKCSCGDYW